MLGPKTIASLAFMPCGLPVRMTPIENASINTSIASFVIPISSNIGKVKRVSNCAVRGAFLLRQNESIGTNSPPNGSLQTSARLQGYRLQNRMKRRCISFLGENRMSGSALVAAILARQSVVEKPESPSFAMAKNVGPQAICCAPKRKSLCTKSSKQSTASWDMEHVQPAEHVMVKPSAKILVTHLSVLTVLAHRKQRGPDAIKPKWTDGSFKNLVTPGVIPLVVKVAPHVTSPLVFAAMMNPIVLAYLNERFERRAKNPFGLAQSPAYFWS